MASAASETIEFSPGSSLQRQDEDATRWVEDQHLLSGQQAVATSASSLSYAGVFDAAKAFSCQAFNSFQLSGLQFFECGQLAHTSHLIHFVWSHCAFFIGLFLYQDVMKIRGGAQRRLRCMRTSHQGFKRPGHRQQPNPRRILEKLHQLLKVDMENTAEEDWYPDTSAFGGVVREWWQVHSTLRFCGVLLQKPSNEAFSKRASYMMLKRHELDSIFALRGILVSPVAVSASSSEVEASASQLLTAHICSAVTCEALPPPHVLVRWESDT